MLIEELEMGVVDLKNGKQTVLKLKRDKSCTQGLRLERKNCERRTPKKTKMTATDFVTLILVIGYNSLE
jgi:hypothetical protein